MANTDFKSIMVRNVTFAFPRLAETYRFSTADKRSIACAPRAQGANYSIGWEMAAADAGKLHAELKAHYESCGRKEPFEKVFGMKKLDDGSFSFSAKRNGVNGKGEENPLPRVIDCDKQPFADVGSLWTGTKGTLKVTAVPVTDPNGAGGISLLLDVVQVIEAVTGGSGLDDFDTIAPVGRVADPDLGDFGEADPFASLPQAVRPAPMDDEIPFAPIMLI